MQKIILHIVMKTNRPFMNKILNKILRKQGVQQRNEIADWIFLSLFMCTNASCFFFGDCVLLHQRRHTSSVVRHPFSVRPQFQKTSSRLLL